MSIGVECPSCQNKFQVATQLAGQEIQCILCRHKFAVPAPAVPPPPGSNPRLGILVSHPSSYPLDKGREASGLSPSPAPPRSGRRLTTLVLDAVKVVLGKSDTARSGVPEITLIALTLAMTGLAITWPFRLAGMGLILGLVGLGLAGFAVGKLKRRKESLGALPILAALLNGQAFFMALALAMAPDSAREPGGEKIVQVPATAKLIPLLEDADPAVRVKALEQAGEVARDLEGLRGHLVTALHDDQDTVRTAAALALGHLGPPARVAYPLLLGLAKGDPVEAVRLQAERTLKKLSPPTHADLSDLLATLKEPHAGLRSAAAQALALLGAEAKEAGAALDKALGDADAGVRISAAQALWEIHKDQAKDVVRVLVEGLKDAKADVRGRAALALGKMQTTDDKAIAGLEKALRDPDSGVRRKVVFALGEMAAKKAVVPLLDVLHDPDIKVRMMAASALWALAQETRGVTVLADALKHRDADIRLNAAVALSQFGRQARSAVGPLSDALKDADAQVRARAAEALSYIGPEAREAVGGLRDALKSEDPALRAMAAYALSEIGKQAAAANPDLHKALTDADAGVRLFAARALWFTEGQANVVLPVMLQVLKDKETGNRSRAAVALGLLGGKADEAVADLHEALHDPDPTLKAAAAKALGDIGSQPARVAYPALFELTKEDDEHIHKAAADAMKKLGRPTRNDVQTLIGVLNHPYPRFRASAAVSLWLLHKDARPAVAALGRKLEDGDETVRTTAAFALAAIGPDAAPAIPDLIKALGHKDPVLRGRAAYTLGEIGARDVRVLGALNQVLAKEEILGPRFQAARALWVIAQKSKEANALEILSPQVIVVLGQVLETKGLDTREQDDKNLDNKEIEQVVQAADTLAQIGSRVAEAKGAEPLKQALKDKGVGALRQVLLTGAPALRSASASALSALGMQARAALPALMQALEDDAAEVRAAVAEALGKIADAEAKADKKAVQAKAAYATLLFFSKVDQNERVQRAANVALAKIGKPGPEDADVLLTILENTEQPVFFRTAALQVLGIVGPEVGPEVAGRLGKKLRDRDDAGVRALAAYALGEIGAKAATEKRTLLDALRDPDAGVQVGAAFALGEIFQSSPKKLPDLIAALQQAAVHPDENVAVAARAALKKIQGK